MSVLAVSSVLHDVLDKESGARIKYYPHLRIQHANREDWTIHVGDVAAFSTASSEIEDITDWKPNHLEKPSPHWKVGLVLSLSLTLTPKGRTYSAHVLWLEKALDLLPTLGKSEKKKLTDTFRKFSKSQPCSKLPHVLVATSDIEQIPLLRVLPVHITMISENDFGSQGLEYDYQSDPFALRFCCARRYHPETKEVRREMDQSWIALNPTTTAAVSPPASLDQAWSNLDDPELRKSLRQAFPSLQATRRDSHQSRLRRSPVDANLATPTYSNQTSEVQGAAQKDKVKEMQKSKKRSLPTPAKPAKKAKTKDSKKQVRVFAPTDKKKALEKKAPPSKKKTKSKTAGVGKRKNPKGASKKKAANVVPSTPSTCTVSTATASTTSPASYDSRCEVEVRSSPSAPQPILVTADREYYTAVQMSINRGVYESQASYKKKERPMTMFDVQVGSIQAVHTNQATATEWSPFQYEWGFAQVLAIYRDLRSSQSNSHDDDSNDAPVWKVTIRWFYRWDELTKDEQKRVPEEYDTSMGLFEKTAHIDTCDIGSILPARITFASSNNWKKAQKKTAPNDWLPRIRRQCQYVISGKPTRTTDAWSNFPNEIVERVESWIRPLRGSSREHYISFFNDRKDGATKRSALKTKSSTIYSKPRTLVSKCRVHPVQKRPVAEIGKTKFYDEVDMEIDMNFLEKAFRPQQTSWIVKVGHIVPVRCGSGKTSKSPSFSPFRTEWDAGQVVALYQTPSKEWMMQARWFYRFNHLPKACKERIDSSKLDKDRVCFETEHYEIVPLSQLLPGRVILSSTDSGDWGSTKSPRTGLPLIPRLCGCICLEEEIDAAHDWTDYDILLHSIPKPLSRGLLLQPANRNNKEWISILYQTYKTAISNRSVDGDFEIFRKWSLGRPVEVVDNDNRLAFDEEQILVNPGPSIGNTRVEKEHCLASVNISVPRSCYETQAQRLLQREAQHRFDVRPGDVVCYRNERAQYPDDRILSKNIKCPWTPFKFSWSYGQVLSIYYNQKCPQSPRLLCVEIRALARPSELPATVSPFAPERTHGDDFEEVYETDMLPCTTLPAQWLIGTVDAVFGLYKPSRRPNSLQLSCRMRSFFFSSHNQFQELRSAGISQDDWLRDFRIRGTKLSTIAKQFQTQAEKTACERSPAPRSGSLVLRKTPNSSSPFVPRARLTKNTGKISSTGSREIVYDPSKSIYHDLLFVNVGQPRWSVRLGDFVAIYDRSSPSGKAMFPYNVSWTAGKVVSFFDNDTETPPAHLLVPPSNSSFMLTIQPFTVVPANQNNPLPTLEDAGTPSISVSSADVLGPLLGSKKETSADRAALASIPSCLCSIPNEELLSKTSKTSTTLHEKMEYKCWVESTPIHVDESTQRIFYSDFFITPQSRGSDSTSSKATPWNAKMGDMVLFETHGPKRYPFDCNWSVAEIVTIWTEVAPFDGSEEKDDENLQNCEKRVMLELRTFFEVKDIEGKAIRDGESDSVDEVFETDYVSVVDAFRSLLAPTSISTSESDSLDHSGVPMPRFVCHRFWSTKRKSLVPCGNENSRMERGWLYSNALPCDMRQGKAKKQTTPAVVVPSWTEATQNILKKLSLKDASRGAFERGEVLIGRENELNKLLTFLRAAIRGDAGSGGIKSSLFVAGCPGVGKTACVRIALTKLKAEQARGEVPGFDFIPLNCMEMRHPFESYIKLWEAISGVSHSGSFDVACSRLERHFTNPNPKADTDKPRITVVLLDEIDYLVTEKQTVLYNFFDWPKRAAEVNNGKRLIVVGISNTLNLAEQMMPSVRSRIGTEKCVFKAYDLASIKAILKAKIDEAAPQTKIFDNDAIDFAAKKTSALSGDIRKAFQICRVALELVLKKNKIETVVAKVQIGDIQKASHLSFKEALVVAVSYSSSYQALILVALATLERSTGREMGGFDISDIMTKTESIAAATGERQYSPAPSFAEMLSLLVSLGELNLVEMVTSTETTMMYQAGNPGGTWPMTSLKVDEFAIRKGLKKTSHKVLVDKNLPMY